VEVLKDELKKARLAAGLTQESLAWKAKISREYVSYLERGKYEPTVKMFVKLCRAMNVYAPDLLKRVVPKLNQPTLPLRKRNAIRRD
jgi:transcriptional regulator with XRE-family HTH domain